MSLVNKSRGVRMEDEGAPLIRAGHGETGDQKEEADAEDTG